MSAATKKKRALRAVREGDVEVRALPGGDFRLVAFGPSAGCLTLRTRRQVLDAHDALLGFMRFSIEQDKLSE